MSQICIIGTSNIKHISLISLYTLYFDEKRIPYDIIYIDRYGINEYTTAHNQYCYHADNLKSKYEKILAFFKFRMFAKKIIKRNKYKLLITWQTTSAYLFADLLLGKYAKKYIINIRDFVAEDKFPFRILIKRLVKCSAMNTISSNGFRKFLPHADYVLVNSINESLIKKILGDSKKVKQPFKIGFAGNCRYFRESYKLIDALGNDERFELWYCGTNSDVLQKYAEEKGVKNVKTLPSFDPEETIRIFNSFDIVNSAFGNDAMDNSTLMPIRLYTAISLYLPVLVNCDTQLEQEVEKGQIGFVIRDYKCLADNLYDYLNNLDRQLFRNSCDNYLSSSKQQNKLFYHRLNSLIEGL